MSRSNGKTTMPVVDVEPPRRFCKARMCTGELDDGGVLLGPNGEETPFCLRHYRAVLKNLVEVPWGPLELTNG